MIWMNIVHNLVRNNVYIGSVEQKQIIFSKFFFGFSLNCFGLLFLGWPSIKRSSKIFTILIELCKICSDIILIYHFRLQKEHSAGTGCCIASQWDNIFLSEFRSHQVIDLVKSLRQITVICEILYIHNDNIIIKKNIFDIFSL